MTVARRKRTENRKVYERASLSYPALLFIYQSYYHRVRVVAASARSFTLLLWPSIAGTRHSPRDASTASFVLEKKRPKERSGYRELDRQGFPKLSGPFFSLPLFIKKRQREKH